MSPRKKKEPEGEDIEGYLREFKKVREKERTPEKPWIAGGEADQDLASIFQEFEQRASAKGGALPKAEAGSFIEEAIESELDGKNPHPPPESDEEAVPTKSGRSAGTLYNTTKAYVAESIRRAGSDRLPDLEKGAELVGRMIDSLTCTSSAKVRHFESSAKRQCEPMLIGLV